jgi:diguanylate cyclase (GGDEF)-like protein
VDSAVTTREAVTARRLPEPIVYTDDLPGARKDIPVRAFTVSLLALGVATVGAFTSPEILGGYDALSWLLLLIPVFLFSYYRGWQGSVRVLVGGAVFILTIELVAAFVFRAPVGWVFLFVVALVLLAVGIGSGVLSELLHRERLIALAYAYSDPLTGLPNRRLLDFMLDKVFAAGQRGHDYAVVLFGVDRLKDYNSEFGRGAGDEALQLIAEVLNEHTRRMNTSGRYYADKFLAVLLGADRDGAWVFAERVRETIAELTLPSGAALTVSAGIALANPSGRHWDERVEAAENAIGRAKNLGGDCCICAGEY